MLLPKELKPKQALNKAFLKVKPIRADIERFKTNLIQLLDRADDSESEEFHKNLVSDFLKETYYKPSHFINTKGRNDLVIHNGPKANSSVGVIIEAKKHASTSEMISGENLNRKAFHELVLYYLRERITHNNLEVKHLLITNLYEWYIFDASLFDRLFAQNKRLVHQFIEFVNGRLSGSKTDFFYRHIAEPFIAGIDAEVEFTYFDLREYQKALSNTDKSDPPLGQAGDKKLIALFKLLSPEHLLKLPFANDSNSLDRRFYSELLHIIGLTETTHGGKNLIGRKPPESRFAGSLLEDTIIQLDSLDKINRLERPSQFGNSQPERLFNVALELSITWINRILFLKLLEAQLIRYNQGDKSFAFLSLKKIKSYHDLNTLFFQVLAKRNHERNHDVQLLFEQVPYLNSSLFEPTMMEQVTLFISNLNNDKTIPIISSTVLKDKQGKRRTGSLPTLEYLFEFLDAYDFSSEGSEEIQEENKALINASVLGLIFEKINGNKDGSFFTPGFITMYMCRETIRKAVLQKFNETKGWDCQDLGALYDRIEDRGEANHIVDSIKICDPAVGSGHFLVSALNEMIAVKNDLRILQDRRGRRLKEYQVEVINDELIVTDEQGELFEYRPGSKESQRIQEALFHEKQTIIEKCLFGVDINPNSVKICRLRLWIELLKSAYYRESDHPDGNASPVCYADSPDLRPEFMSHRELETLPNIDINIKCGNSLISRFALDADLSQALKKSKWTIDGYRIAVDTYRNADDKEQKREMERLIGDIKSDFRSEINKNDPKIRRKAALGGELFNLTMQTGLFEESPRQKKERLGRIAKVEAELNKIDSQIEEIKANKIFENAFEWRFEFPEVLNDAGGFIGFDVVMGNPPYIRQEEIKLFKPYFEAVYTTFSGTADLYVYFVEKGLSILKREGHFVFILPNKWMRAGYGTKLRQYLGQKNIEAVIDFGDLRVFEEATTYPCVLFIQNKISNGFFKGANVETLKLPKGLANHVNRNFFTVNSNFLPHSGWSLKDQNIQTLIEKINSRGVTLREYTKDKIYYGIKTGLNEAFVIDQATRDKIIAEDPKADKLIKPFLAGRDIKRYLEPQSSKYLILIPKGFTIKRNLDPDDPNYISMVEEPPRYGYMESDSAWHWFSTNYPSIANHLKAFEKKARQRSDQGDFWWELRACDYYDEFAAEKIIYPNILKRPEFTWDGQDHYTNQKCFIISQADKHLLGILNSKLTYFLFESILPKLRGGFFEPSYVYFKNFPIARDEDGMIAKLVDEILEIKKQNPKTDTSDLEQQINQLVYQLYDLTEEEMALIEASLPQTTI